MPSRKRPKAAAPVPDDPVKRFAAAVQESEARQRARREREQRQRVEAAEIARRVAEHAEALAEARRALERSIEAARAARRAGRGVAAADAAWKAAKARVIELETGAPPSWAARATDDALSGEETAGED